MTLLVVHSLSCRRFTLRLQIIPMTLGRTGTTKTLLLDGRRNFSGKNDKRFDAPSECDIYCTSSLHVVVLVTWSWVLACSCSLALSLGWDQQLVFCVFVRQHTTGRGCGWVSRKRQPVSVWFSQLIFLKFNLQSRLMVSLPFRWGCPSWSSPSLLTRPSLSVNGPID